MKIVQDLNDTTNGRKGHRQVRKIVLDHKFKQEKSNVIKERKRTIEEVLESVCDHLANATVLLSDSLIGNIRYADKNSILKLKINVKRLSNRIELLKDKFESKKQIGG